MLAPKKIASVSTEKEAAVKAARIFMEKAKEKLVAATQLTIPYRQAGKDWPTEIDIDIEKMLSLMKKAKKAMESALCK